MCVCVGGLGGGGRRGEKGGKRGFALVFKTEKSPLYAFSLSHQEHSPKLRRDVNIVSPMKNSHFPYFST